MFKSTIVLWILCHTVGFPGGSDGKKKSTCNTGDLGSIPGLGKSPGEKNGNPLQYFCLETSVDRGAWWATVHGFTKSWTRLSDWQLLHTCCTEDLRTYSSCTPKRRAFWLMSSCFPPYAQSLTFYVLSLIILDSLISGFMQYLYFYVWLISLSIMSSRFIHVVIIQMSGFSSFLRINNIPPRVFSIQPHFLYGFVQAHLLKVGRHLMQPHPLL